jgi:hypothetical protein
VFGERRVAVARLCRDVMVLLRDEGAGLDEAQKNAAQKTIDELARRFGYQNTSTADAAAVLVVERFADALS